MYFQPETLLYSALRLRASATAHATAVRRQHSQGRVVAAGLECKATNAQPQGFWLHAEQAKQSQAKKKKKKFKIPFRYRCCL